MQRKKPAAKKRFVHFTPFETVDAQNVLGERSQAYKRFKNMALVVPSPMRRNLFSSLRAVQRHDPAFAESLKRFSAKLPLHAGKLPPAKAKALREAATRVNTLASLLELQKELDIPHKELERVLTERNIKPLIQGLFKEYFIKRGLGIQLKETTFQEKLREARQLKAKGFSRAQRFEQLSAIHPDALKVISNPEMISRSLAYNRDYRRDRNQHHAYIEGWKAFLEGGEKGVKRFKFSQAGEVFKDAKLASFVSEIDKAVGRIRPGGEKKEVNLHDIFTGKLADFESHAKDVDLKKLIDADKLKLDKALKEIDFKSVGVDEHALTEMLLKQDVEALNSFMEELKKRQVKGKGGKLKGALLGVIGNHLSVLNSVKAFEIARALHKLPGEPEAQYKFLDSLKKKYGDQTIASLGKLFESLARKNPKPLFGDLAFFMNNISHPPRASAGETVGGVTSRITFNLADLLRVGKFEHNCQNIGNTSHNHGLLSFSFDPAELTLGHYSGGELVGFSFVHVVKGKDRNFVVIERAYSDHGNLKGEMNEQREEMARRINEAAQKAGVEVRAGTKEQLKGKEVRSYPSAFGISKYYDVAAGSVSGWGQSFSIHG